MYTDPSGYDQQYVKRKSVLQEIKDRNNGHNGGLGWDSSWHGGGGLGSNGVVASKSSTSRNSRDGHWAEYNRLGDPNDEYEKGSVVCVRTWVPTWHGPDSADNYAPVNPPSVKGGNRGNNDEPWWNRKVGNSNPPTQQDIDRILKKQSDIITVIEVITYTIVGTKGLATLFNFVKGLTTSKNPWDEINWPKPPKDDTFTIGNPSRQKANNRGENSLYDSSGGEWRWDANGHGNGPHWDYKPSGNNQPWKNIFN